MSAYGARSLGSRKSESMRVFGHLSVVPMEAYARKTMASRGERERERELCNPVNGMNGINDEHYEAVRARLNLGHEV